jgi:hypothetical protein
MVGALQPDLLASFTSRMADRQITARQFRQRSYAILAAALRMAALSLGQSQTAQGAYYRKLAQRIGGDVAVFATATRTSLMAKAKELGYQLNRATA